jgi:2-polyprenyl-3-methyl-5-hydroxy-6-metoxy-1,4-benzoquinol methylase
MADHEAALRGLARINALSGAAGPLWRRLASLGLRECSLLDVATGSADLPIALARRAAKAGLDLSITGCDVSEQALSVASAKAAAAGVRLRTLRHDLLAAPLPERADVVTCSLFIHHLDPADAILALRRMKEAARRLLLVHDLRRTRRGLLLARTIPRLLTRSRVVHVDAALSVQGSYTIDELASLAAEAGMPDARISTSWPQRMLLVWEPSR